MGASIESGFIQSLPNITNKHTPSLFGISDQFVSVGTINLAINKYLTQTQYPRTFAGFYQAFYDTAPLVNIDPTASPMFYNTRGQLFNAAIGFSVGPDGLNQADSTFLYNLIGGPSNNNATANFTTKVLDNLFADLSATDLGGNINNYYPNLQTYLASYLTKTTDIFVSSPGFPSYQALYNTFVGGTPQGFQNSLTDFINTMIGKYGYFLPSQMLPQWINQMNTYVNPTATLDLGTGSQQTQIIFELLALVSKMINTLQNVSTAQVQRLKFYANWQQAYTQLISKIPIITFSNLKGRVDAPSDDAIIQATQQIGSINQTYTQQAQGYRDSVSDEAKSQQSAVDQSQQAIQSQSSLATTLLQNLSTILQSLFQG